MANNKNIVVSGATSLQSYKALVKNLGKLVFDALKAQIEKEPEFINKSIDEIKVWVLEQKLGSKMPKAKKDAAVETGFEVEFKFSYNESDETGLTAKIKKSALQNNCVNASGRDIFILEAIIRALKAGLDVEKTVIQPLSTEEGFRARGSMSTSYVAFRSLESLKMPYTQHENNLVEKVMETQQKIIDFIKAAPKVIWGKEKIDDFKSKLLDLIKENEGAKGDLAQYVRWLENGDETEEKLKREMENARNLKNHYTEETKENYLKYRKERLEKLISMDDSNNVVEENKPVEKVEVKKVKKVVKKEKSKVVEAVKESKVIEENKVEVVKDNEIEKIDESIMVDEIKDIEKMEAEKNIAGEAMMEKIRGEVWKEVEKPVESKKIDEIKVIEENKVDEVKKDENIVVDNNIDEVKMEAAEEEKVIIEKIKHLKALRAEIDESINDYEKRLEKIKGLKALKEIEKKQEERKVKWNKKDFEIKVVEKIKPVENKVEAVKADENIIEVKKDDEIKLIDLNKVDESNVEEVVKDLSRECDHQMYLFIKWSSRKSKCPVRLQRNKAKAEKAFEKNQFVNLKIRDLENKFGVKVDI